MTYQNYYNGRKYGKRIPLTHDIQLWKHLLREAINKAYQHYYNGNQHMNRGYIQQMMWHLE